MESDLNKIKRYYYDNKLIPDKDCPKCGNKHWALGGSLLSWICPMCGKVVYTNNRTALDCINKGKYKCPCN